MKKLIILFLFIVVAKLGFSQKYMDDIGTQMCDCMESVPDTLSSINMDDALGMCLIKAISPHIDKLKKDHDIDIMDGSDEAGDKVGEIALLALSKKCPEILMTIATLEEELEDAEVEEEVQYSVIEGTITKVETDKFVVFSIKDDIGKISKYYWLTFIESETELMGKYKKIVGSSVNVSFQKMDFFDPKIEEYRAFNVILKLEFE